MEKYDQSQDTIDVKCLLQQASTDLDMDPAALLDHDMKDYTPQSAVNESNAPADTPARNYQNQATQAIPQGSANSNITGSHSAKRYLDDDETFAREYLDEDAYDPDEEELERAKRRKILIICICAGVLTVLLGLIGLIIFIASDDDGDTSGNDNTEAADLIHDNVFAGGIDLGGKTLEQAKNLLHLETDHTFSNEDMVIKLPGSSINLSPDKTGAELDVDAVAEAAFNYGRDGTVSEDETYNIALLPYLSLDVDYIEDVINSFCENNSSVKTDPQVTVEGSRPQFDPENPNKEVTHQTLKITLGTPEYVLNAEDLYEQVLDAYSMNQMVVEYDAPDMIEPESVDVMALFEEYCTSAQDATINTATYEITQEIYGYGFDPDELQQMIDDAYYGETVEITFNYLIPKVLASDFADDMFIDTLSEYQNSSNMDDSKRDNNLSLACKAINEHVVNAGDTFSFNKVLGKISTKNGYATAPISLYNGSVMGGGVSQISSALYVCALVANLDITERHCHEYAVDFCEMGLDAFVDGDKNDLRFRNNTSSPIRILAETDGGRVRVQIVGVNELDYEVEIVPKVVASIDPLTNYQNMEPDNVLGYVDGDVLQSGITGYKVELYLEKYDLNTGNLLSSSQVATSEYAKLDEVVVRIAPIVTDPTVPDETTDPTDVTETTEPTDITEPSDATEPSVPTEPTQNTDPTVEPTEETTVPTTPEEETTAPTEATAPAA